MAVVTTLTAFVPSNVAFAQSDTLSGEQMHTVTINQSEHGKISFLDSEESELVLPEGDTCTFCVTADEGYIDESITITNSENEEITPVKEDTNYSFVVGNTDVTITATFSAEQTDNTILDKEQTEEIEEIIEIENSDKSEETTDSKKEDATSDDEIQKKIEPEETEEIEETDINTILADNFEEIYARSLELIQNKTLQGKNYYSPRSSSMTVNMTAGASVSYGGYSTKYYSLSDGVQAFCLEPNQKSPSSGTYTATEVQDQLYRAVLYYGYGGPGYTETNLGLYYMIDDSIRTTKTAYVYTHIMAAYVYDGCTSMDAFTGLDSGSVAGLTRIVETINNYAWMVPSNYHAYTFSTGTATQIMGFGTYGTTGNLNLTKTSANPTLTDGNSCYSLAGAEFGVFTEFTCTNQVATLITDAAGNTNTVELDERTYYVKELVAPKGFALSSEIKEVTVVSGQTSTVSFSDVPQSDPVGILLGKIDKETNQNKPQGSASLAGAEFTVKYYDGFYDTDPASQGISATRTWVICTDNEGSAYLADNYKISGDDFYYNNTSIPILPLGTITIQETKSPTGYLLNNEVYVRQITSDNNKEGVYTYNQPTIPEQIIRGGVKIAKRDIETGKTEAQGGATFEGTEIEIISENDYPVMVDGKEYSKGQVVKTLVIDKTNVASTAADTFPAGKYKYRESKSPKGYLLEGKLEGEFSITQNGVIVDLTDSEHSIKDQIIRSDIELAKFGRLSETSEATEMNPLPGIIFSVTSNTTKNTWYMVTNENGYADSKNQKVYSKIITNADGTISVDENSVVARNSRGFFAYDTYTIKELNTPKGYKPINDITVSLNKDGYTYQYILEDKNIMSAIRIVKTDAETGKTIPVAGVTFKLYDENMNPLKLCVTHYPNETYTDEFCTDETGTFILPEKLQVGTYYLEEVDSPYGYLVGQVMKFEVEEGRDWSQPLEIYYPNENVKGKIKITKTDSISGEAVAGAVYGIYANGDVITNDGTVRYVSGELVDTITTDENGEATSKELYLGKFLAKEIEAPERYELDPTEYEVELTYEDGKTAMVYTHLEVKDDPNTVFILKIDKETKEPLVGAKLQLIDADGNIVDEWTTDGKQHKISKLLKGTYTLHEEEAPEGYNIAEDMEIEITGGIVPTVIEMEDAPIQIKIDKKSEIGESLTGATLQLIDTDGKIVDEWITDGTPHEMYAIPSGTYILHEEEAPYGYVLAEDMEIEIKQTEEIQYFTMIDGMMGTIRTSMKGASNTPQGSIIEKIGNIVFAPKTGDSTNIMYFLLLAIGSFIIAGIICMKRRKKRVAFAIANNQRKEPKRTIKKKNLGIFFLLVVSILTVNCGTVFAKTKNNTITRHYEYITSDKTEKSGDFEENIKEGKNTYTLENVDYEVIKSVPVMETEEVTKTIESDLMMKSDDYIPENTITEDGITYTLQDCSVIDGSEYTETYTAQYNYMANDTTIPKNKVIGVTAENGANVQINSELSSTEEISDGEWHNATISITFEHYDTGIFNWQDQTIYLDSEHPLEGYSTELLESVGADANDYQVVSTQWSGEPYEIDGVVYRDATANVQYFENYVRATYKGTINYVKYQSTYKGTHEVESTENSTYLMKATATYAMDEGLSITEIVIFTAIGIAILAILVVLILYVISKRKKDNKKEEDVVLTTQGGN